MQVHFDMVMQSAYNGIDTRDDSTPDVYLSS